MESLKLWARHGEAVRQAIERGELVHLETASAAFTDAFLLFAIESGLSQTWAQAFPAPREEPEMGMEVILPAHMAGRLAGRYSLRKTGSVLRSARVLGALGSRVEVIEPAQGLSWRGTADDTLFRGDVVRKRLVKMEPQADLSQPAPGPAQEPRVRVKVRQRASRRAVQPAVDETEAAARALKVAEQLGRWDNQQVGGSMRKYARLGRGRRRHILDTPPGEVPVETGTYEGSGVVRHEAGTSARGDKLATLRTLLDRAGLLSQVALSAIQVHDGALCRPVLAPTPVLRAGELGRQDRGFSDGATLSPLQRQRRVEVIMPLKASMLATQEALQLAEMADKGESHPARDAQRIARVRHVAHMWAEGAVPLPAWVMRYWNTKKTRREYIVLVTTDLRVSASWMGRHYEERPEIAQDYQQMKRGGWQLTTLSSTR